MCTHQLPDLLQQEPLPSYNTCHAFTVGELILRLIRYAQMTENILTNRHKFLLCKHRAKSESTAQWTSPSPCQLVQDWTAIGYPTCYTGLLQAKLLRSNRSNVWNAKGMVKNCCWSTSFLGSGCHCLEVTCSEWDECCCSAGGKVPACP